MRRLSENRRLVRAGKRWAGGCHRSRVPQRERFSRGSRAPPLPWARACWSLSECARQRKSGWYRGKRLSSQEHELRVPGIFVFRGPRFPAAAFPGEKNDCSGSAFTLSGPPSSLSPGTECTTTMPSPARATMPMCEYFPIGSAPMTTRLARPRPLRKAMSPSLTGVPGQNPPRPPSLHDSRRWMATRHVDAMTA